MYQYINGQKVPINRESYKQRAPQASRTLEKFSMGGNGKCPKWLWIVLAVIAGIILIALVVMLLRSRKAQKSEPMSFGRKGRFGFRYY